MLSSKMAASIAIEISIHLCKHLFIVCNSFSMNFSIRGSSVRVIALDIQFSLRNLMAMLEDSMTSVKTLY